MYDMENLPKLHNVLSVKPLHSRAIKKGQVHTDASCDRTKS